jgi:hypothetical protein
VGLDSVEFVMAIEDAFQIAIPDEVAERLLTPGQVVDYVLGRLSRAERQVCLEQRAFYRLRRATMRVLAVPRSAVHPHTRWVEVLPRRQTRHNWELLHQAASVPKWPRLTLWGKVPAEVATVGELARHLSSHSAAALQGDDGWTRAGVEETMRVLMREHLRITQFEWSQQFVRDLGVD